MQLFFWIWHLIQAPFENEIVLVLFWTFWKVLKNVIHILKKSDIYSEEYASAT